MDRKALTAALLLLTLGSLRAETAATIQRRIDTVYAAGGGTVWIPRGTTILEKPLRLKSRVKLLGQGREQSTLQLKGGVKAEYVVGTDGFELAKDKNLWTYRAGKPTGTQPLFDESDGLHMGVALVGLTIDGNRRGGAHANGVCLYGGALTVEDVGIFDCDGHGLWTQCGRAGNSWQGDAEYQYANMHESVFQQISICQVTGHGLLYRGPNDSYLDKLQVKMAGGTGVLIDVQPNCESGGLKIGTAHAYATKGPAIHIRSSYVTAEYLDCDTPGQEGLILAGSSIVVDKAIVYYHNRHRDKVSWGVLVTGGDNFIGYLRYANQQTAPVGKLHGGALKVTGKGCAVPHGYLLGGANGVKGTATSGEKVFGGTVRDWGIAP